MEDSTCTELGKHATMSSSFLFFLIFFLMQNDIYCNSAPELSCVSVRMNTVQHLDNINDELSASRFSTEELAV